MGESFPEKEVDEATRRVLGEEPGRYDYLFVDEPEASLDKSKWPTLTPRQQRAFAPFSSDKKESEKLSVDRMLDRLLLPTPESREAAARLVIPRLYDSADPVILRLVDEYVGKQVKDEDILSALQTNQELREELARYFLSKLADPNNLNRLPRRVAVNSGKSHRFGNKDIVNSHEMAVALALSLLDGSFKYGFGAEPVMRDEAGRVVDGQHRAAAEFLVGLPEGTVD